MTDNKKMACVAAQARSARRISPIRNFIITHKSKVRNVLLRASFMGSFFLFVFGLLLLDANYITAGGVLMMIGMIYGVLFMSSNAYYYADRFLRRNGR